MKFSTLAMAAATALTASLHVNAAPAGSMVITINPGPQLVGLPLVNAPAHEATITSATPGIWILDTAIEVPLDVDTRYFVEITGGVSNTWIGERFELDVAATIAAAAPSVHLEPNANLNTLNPGSIDPTGYTLAIRRHITLGQVFGTGENPRLIGTTSPSTADKVSLFDPSTQRFETYYLLRSPNGAIEQWTLIGGGSTNRDGTVIPPGAGVLVSRRAAQTSYLVLTGEVRPHAFAQPLVRGLNLVSEPFPRPHSPQTRGLSAANGFQGATSPNAADQFHVLQDGRFTSFYLLRSPNGAIEQWTQIGGGTISRNEQPLITPDSAVFLAKQSADPDYFVPLSFTP